MSSVSVVSVELGGPFQTAAEAERPQIFLRRATRRVMSKSFDDTVGDMSIPHCVGLMTPFFLKDVKVPRIGILNFGNLKPMKFVESWYYV